MSDNDSARFTLDETRAQAWLADIAPWNHAPFKYEWRIATQRMIHWAVDDGIITDPLHRDAETLALEIQQGGIFRGATYRWLLSVSTGDNPDDYLTLSSPTCELGALTQYMGAEGAIDVLRAAVDAGNGLASELDRYTPAWQKRIAGELVAELAADVECPSCGTPGASGQPCRTLTESLAHPLIERAPEVSALLAGIKDLEQANGGSWPGGDVVDILTSWFDCHGYDLDAPAGASGHACDGEVGEFGACDRCEQKIRPCRACIQDANASCEHDEAPPRAIDAPDGVPYQGTRRCLFCDRIARWDIGGRLACHHPVHTRLAQQRLDEMREGQ